MKFVKRAKIAYIVASAFMIALGLALIIYPELGLSTVCYIVGAFTLLFGIVKIIGYFSKDLFRLAFQFDFALGIFACILGIVILIHPSSVASAMPFTIGVYAMIDGVSKLQTAIDAKKFGFKRWWVLIIFAVITCAAGLFLIINPFEGLKALLILLGVSLIADGVENLCTVLYTVKVSKQSDKFKDAVTLDDGTEFKQ